MQFLQKYLEYRKMRSLIKSAQESIYSEEFDFDKTLVKLMSRTDKLTALVAISFAVYLDDPTTKEDIKEAVTQTKLDLESEKAIQYFLTRYQEQTEIHWLERVESILNGKLAFKENEDSYEGTIYNLEKMRKGPLSEKEKISWRELTTEIENAEQKYNQHIQKIQEKEDEETRRKAQAVIDGWVQETAERRKNMSEDEIQNEIEKAVQEREEIVRRIKDIADKNK